MPTIKKTRKPVTKKTTQKKVSVVTVQQNDKSPKTLSTFPLNDVLGWRDTARKRIQKNKTRIYKLKAQHEAIIREALRLDKQLHSDLTWCKKLNRVIARKVF